MAWAVSCTRHTITAAISIGFPRLSFTFSFSLLKFRVRNETLFRWCGSVAAARFLATAASSDPHPHGPIVHRLAKTAAAVKRIPPVKPTGSNRTLVGPEQNQHPSLVRLEREKPFNKMIQVGISKIPRIIPAQ
jgi:hypothetical protein